MQTTGESRRRTKLTVGYHDSITSSLSWSPESWVSRHGEEPYLPGISLSPAQMFWVSGASVWCARHRPGDLRMSVTLGTHTPSNYRIQVHIV